MMLSSLAHSWRRFWTYLAGPSALGKVAARFACIHTIPSERTYLADFHSKGFISPTARVHHRKIVFGRNVWVGDAVSILSPNQSGTVSLDDGVRIHAGTVIDTGSNANVRIGRKTTIQPGCHLHAHVSDITIGNHVDIAAGCAFYSYNHGMALDQLITMQPLTSNGPIKVGDGAWLGHGVIVLDSVQIGAGAVIGAGSVVVRNIPENAIAAGVPAKVIKYRRA